MVPMADSSSTPHPSRQPEVEAVTTSVLGVGTGTTGVITLNRPRALNALNHSMIRTIGAALGRFARDADIHQVLIRSELPTAFCSGGDVRSVRETDLADNFAAGNTFFRDEYDLNHELATFPKPVIALIDGITMGGGLGISMHASHRIITTRTWASMPEAAIGFVTDVGISHVFTHLPALSSPDKPSLPLGLWLATTAYRLSAGDLLWTGLATHLVSDARDFTDTLCAHGLGAALASAVPAKDYPASELSTRAESIDRLFSSADISAIMAQLRAEQQPEQQEKRQDKHQESEQTAELTLRLLAPANPLSIEAIAQLLVYSAHSSLRGALNAEFALGSWARRQPNFSEGVRAVLVDKTQDAAFIPATLGEINDEERGEISRILSSSSRASG